MFFLPLMPYPFCSHVYSVFSMLEMYGGGLINYLHAKYGHPPKKQCEEVKNQRIELFHIEDLFIIALSLTLLAAVALFVEYAAKQWCKVTMNITA